MKKQWIITGVFALVSNIALAQWSVGASAGFNLTFWNWRFSDPASSLSTEPGLNIRAAVPLERRINRVLTLRLEGAYAQRDARWRTTYTDIEGSFVYKHAYRFYEGGAALKIFPSAQKQYLYLLAGGNVAYLQNAAQVLPRTVAERLGARERSPLLKQDADQLNRTHAYADLGIGIQTSARKHGRFFGECRLQQDLKKLYRNPESNVRHRSLVVSLGYLASLSR